VLLHHDPNRGDDTYSRAWHEEYSRRLGGHRFLDPELMVALLMLRRLPMDEHAPATAADMLLIDTAVLSYFHLLRVNGWVGNLAAMVEIEFFGNVGLQTAFKVSNGHQLGRVKGLRITEHVERIGEQLMPLMDRSHRMMLRSLNAFHARRHRHGPSSPHWGQPPSTSRVLLSQSRSSISTQEDPHAQPTATHSSF
jgi:hypothetical protein